MCEYGDAFKTLYNGNFASWPGVAFKNDCYYQPADGYNWKHYYFYEIPTSLYGKSFKFIVNKTGQTADLTLQHKCFCVNAWDNAGNSQWY